MYHNDQPKKIASVLHYLIAVSILGYAATKDCTLPQCINEAERLLDSINENINPCEDFVEFTCEKQFKKFDSIKKQLDPGPLELTTYRLHLWWIRLTLQRKLDEPDHLTDLRILKLMKTFWRSCKNVTSEDALMNVRILLKRLGGWPLITKSWKEKHFTWDKFSRCARRLGFLPRMFIFVGLNVDNIKKLWHPNDTITLTIEKPKFIDSTGTTPETIQYDIGYHTIAEYISGSDNLTIAEIDAALNFAQKLKNLSCAPKEQHSEIMSIKQLQERFPIIDWFKYIKAMLRARQAKYLTDYNCLIVDVCYVSAFAKIIPKTAKSIQANYAFMAIISDLFAIIRPQLTLAFITDREEITQICFDTAAAIFNKVMDVIIGRELNSNLTSKLEKIENHIYKKTLHLIQTIPWMDVETRYLTHQKLYLTTFESPFPDDIFNNNYFLRLNYKSNDSLAAILREMNIFLVDNYYLQAGRTKNQYGIYQQEDQMMRAIFQESISPHMTLIKPDIFANKIYKPAGAILHNHLAVSKELDFINYATIGVQLGVSLTHLIYQKGAHVDIKGKWHMQSWWNEATQKQFIQRPSCQVIGVVEPIADASMIFGLIGGVEIAYIAMFDECSTTCTTTFEGLNFDTRQLFWITLIASDCDRNLKLRYNTMLSHNKNFIKDFKCNSESKMFVGKQCKMWTT